MSHLQIALLGPPQVLHPSQTLTFSTRKELALLAYLAVHKGVHTRKKLTELLWPESDEVRGRAAFRITLSRLRDALREGAIPGEETHLLVESTNLSLKQANLSLDLQVVETACALAHRLSTGKMDRSVEHQQAALYELEQASGLVRGQFLQDFSLRDTPAYEDWIRSQQAYWQVRLRLLFDQLTALYENRQAYDQALEIAQKWLGVDPLQEEGYLRLMHFYELRGDRRAALQVYETCREVLERDLHAIPSAPLLALAERLQRGSAYHPQTEATLAHSLEPAAIALAHLPLIGRDSEFATLMTCYQRVQQARELSHLQIVLLEGEAGIGKTRLAHEFLHWAQQHGADVLHGRAFEMGGRLPYQPLITALRPRLDAENAPDDLLADVWLAELSRLLPELRERYPDLPAPTQDDELGSSRLFEAVARLMQAWAQRQPLVLLLDDLHWADTASLDLLLYLVGSFSQQDTPFLLLLALRSEALRGASPLLPWKTTLEHTAALTHLTLTTLTAGQTHEVVRMLAGVTGVASKEQDEVTQPVGQWLYHETAGQPFYLLETLKLLLERKAIEVLHGQDGSWSLDFTDVLNTKDEQTSLLPGGVHRLIQARLATLSPVTASFLLAGAVLDQQASFEGMCTVAAMSESEGLLALEHLLEQRFLIERRPEAAQRGETVYLFTHDKIREVVYAEANAARRRVFHRQAFELLQQVEVPAAELAWHAYRGGYMEVAFRYSMQAGDEAIKTFALQDAVTFYLRAKQILNDTSEKAFAAFPLSASAQKHLLLQLGRAYELLQHWSAARQNYETLHSYAQRQRDDHLQCVALNRLVQVLAHDTAQLPRMRILLMQARQAARRCGDEALLKETLWNEFQQGGAAWDQKALTAWGEQRALRTQEVQNWLIVAQRLTGFAYNNPQMTRWEQAQATGMQAIVWYQQQGASEMEAYSWDLLAAVQLHDDKLREALVFVKNAQRLAEQSKTMFGWNIICAFQAYILLLQGDIEKAWILIQEVVIRARRFGFLPQFSANLFILSDIALLFPGSNGQALSAAQEGLELGQRLESLGDVELHASRLCNIYAQRGEWMQALGYAEQAQAAREDYALPLFLAPSHYETETWLRAGKRDEAEREIERLERRLTGSRRHRISLLRSQAVLTRHDGEAKQALDSLQEAEQLAHDIGLPGERWQILAAIGEIYEMMADYEHAQEAFTQAQEIVQALAERIDDEALRAQFLAGPSVQYVFQQIQVVAQKLL